MKAWIRRWAINIKRDVVAVSLATRDPRVPWFVKVLAACIAGYALSPIDLIPDFIPILGHLDDMVLLPLGVLAVIKLMPPEVMEELRAEAENLATSGQANRLAAAVIILFWVVAVAMTVAWIAHRIFRGA